MKILNQTTEKLLSENIYNWKLKTDQKNNLKVEFEDENWTLKVLNRSTIDTPTLNPNVMLQNKHIRPSETGKNNSQ